jgi:DNA-binding response OmpR family regulator
VTTSAQGHDTTPSEAIAVLVVSDDPRVGEEIDYGAPSHVKAEIVPDSRAAWSRLQLMTPAVVVVDIQTGSAGGYGLARDMRADRRFSDTPILMLLERDQDGWLAKQAGASLWRTKPVEVSTLVGELLSLVRARAADTGS